MNGVDECQSQTTGGGDLQSPLRTADGDGGRGGAGHQLFASVMRWRRRERLGQPVRQTPGPKKSTPLNWAEFSAPAAVEFRTGAHARRRQVVRKVCPPSLSRRELGWLVQDYRQDQLAVMKRIQWLWSGPDSGGHHPRFESPTPPMSQRSDRLRGLPRCRPAAAVEPAATQTNFWVAAPAIWSDDRRNSQRTSTQPRHSVAGHCGILAPLPGPDRRPPKQKCVNHFYKNLVSKLNWPHNYARHYDTHINPHADGGLRFHVHGRFGSASTSR